MSRDINRFNGKYLKCVVTPNITSTDVLKNSGSIIVYHPSLKYSTKKYLPVSWELFGDNSNSIFRSLNEILELCYKNAAFNNINVDNINVENLRTVEIDENTVTNFTPIDFLKHKDDILGNNIFDSLINQFDENLKIEKNNDILAYTISPWNDTYKDTNDQIYSLDKLGSLEDRPTENNINYLFLGNEFIASGFGFRTIDERDNMIWLSENYNSILKSLYEIDYINYSLITDMYNKVWPLFNKYIKINGGDVSKTIVHIKNHFISDEGEEIKLIDVLAPGKEADYKDVEITKTTIKITINGDDNEYNNENDNEYIVDNINDIYVPIGSSVNKISYYITGLTNDCGGVKFSEMSYNYFVNSEQYNSNSAIVTDLYTHYNAESINVDTFNINYEFIYNINDTNYRQYFIKEGKQSIINYIKLQITGTPDDNIHYYPWLESKKQIQLASLGNIIPDHEIILDSVNIIGLYPVFYNTGKVTGYDNINDYIVHKNSSTNDWNIKRSDLKKGMIKNNCIEIKINKNNNYLFIAIPIKFAVYKVEFEDGISHFIHNWTGCLKKYNTKQSTGNITEDYENIFNIDAKDIRYMKCNLYTLVIGRGVSVDGKIKIYVNDTYNGASQNIIFTNTITDNINTLKTNYVFDEDTATYIQNNEFNDTYWLTSGYVKTNPDFYLANYMSNFNYNGGN